MPASSCRVSVVLMRSRREFRRVLVGDGSGRSSSPAWEGGPLVRGCVWIAMPVDGDQQQWCFLYFFLLFFSGRGFCSLVLGSVPGSSDARRVVVLRMLIPSVL